MKSFLDIAPLLVFLITYKKYDLITATIALVITTIITVAILAIKTRTISKIQIVTALILSISGFCTWYFDNSIFIKVKPTVINLIFAAILLYGYFTKKPMLKYIFNNALSLNPHAWISLSLRWGVFFIFLSIINELVWRNLSEANWVNFKVFGFLLLTLLFTISQLPYMLRNQVKNK
jgi:intracellular septation protein